MPGPAAAIAIPAIASLIGGYLSSRGNKSKTSQASPYPLSSFMPPELLSIFDPSYRGGEIRDTDLGKAMKALLAQASEGLPEVLRQRGIANISSGFGSALDRANQNVKLRPTRGLGLGT